jgi:hypothetical protein
MPAGCRCIWSALVHSTVLRVGAAVSCHDSSAAAGCHLGNVRKVRRFGA